MTAPTVTAACAAGWCTADATVYLAGPYLGPSARCTIVAGPRAAALTAGDPGNARCLECPLTELEQHFKETL